MTDCIAIPVADGRVDAHFGHAREFVFVTINGDHEERRSCTPPQHVPGALPRWLADQGATHVVAGGMGGKAVEILHQRGLRCILGVPAISVDEVVAGFRTGSLQTGLVVCTHDDGHDCSHA